MKKIIGLIGIVVLCVLGYAGFKYYSETYNTTKAYAQIPNEVPAKVETLDSNGKKINGSYSYNYEVTFIKENGERQQMKFELTGTNPEPFKPGSFIQAEVSKDRVNNPSQIQESELPNKVKEMIN